MSLENVPADALIRGVEAGAEPTKGSLQGMKLVY